ncbi:MAG: SPOR domain-containing protein, partial [Alphaproteobacteria bacterium]|nr:SPOR domain-containing protein [Alphaproteobacteria bacterium]
YPQQSYGPEYGQQQPVQPAAPNSNQDYVNPQAQNFQQQPQQQVVSPAPVATNMQPVQENSQQVNDALPKEQSGDAQQVMPSAQNDPMTSSADAAKNEPSAETIPSVEEVKKNRIEAQAEANQESAVDNQDADSEKQMKPIQTQATPLKAGYYIQLGSVMPNAKSVESEWHRLRRKYTSELGSFKPIYKNVDVGVRKKYRLLIGPFSHRNSALKKCMRIGNGCRVLQVGSAKR